VKGSEKRLQFFGLQEGLSTGDADIWRICTPDLF
jgi:hypothetical protein